MKLIIGLGNPGTQYANTRHNAGFIALDEIQKTLGFAEFKLEKKFAAELAEKNIGGEKIILAKPQTFMNLSGEAAQKIMSFYKITPADIIIVHDDLDIELGAYKISLDSSAAGHNGVQSIFDILGMQKIKRVRLGIEGAERKKDRLSSGSDFVLENFTTEEIAIVRNLASKIATEIC